MSLVRLRPEAPRCRNSGAVCGRSSSGRARPCQGRGSEFEPRRPLHKSPPKWVVIFLRAPRRSPSCQPAPSRCRGRQSGHFLETASLLPPQAALRRFPRRRGLPDRQDTRWRSACPARRCATVRGTRERRRYLPNGRRQYAGAARFSRTALTNFIAAHKPTHIFSYPCIAPIISTTNGPHGSKSKEDAVMLNENVAKLLKAGM